MLLDSLSAGTLAWLANSFDCLLDLKEVRVVERGVLVVMLAWKTIRHCHCLTITAYVGCFAVMLLREGLERGGGRRRMEICRAMERARGGQSMETRVETESGERTESEGSSQQREEEAWNERRGELRGGSEELQGEREKRVQRKQTKGAAAALLQICLPGSTRQSGGQASSCVQRGRRGECMQS